LLFPTARIYAQTSISASQTTPVTTSTAGDVTIVSGGSVNVGGGAAITVDSGNSVTNSGAISGADAPITGILITAAGAATAGTIDNGGTITVTDSTLATTIPLTAGTNRFGIVVNATSPFVGDIVNDTTGSITVRGNNSAGIYVQQGGLVGNTATGGTATGSITNSGTIGITGDGSFGILTAAGTTIAGNITIANVITSLGSVSSSGIYAGGIQLNGSVAGQLDIDSTVRSTGFYNNAVTTVRPTTFTGVTAVNELIGGASVSVNGNVAGDILVDTSGFVVSYGSAPALQIAPAAGASAEIGTLGGAYGLQVVGQISANGIYDNISAQAIQIGGGGGTATIDNAMDVTGKVTAVSYAANATGITVGAGGNVSQIINSGTISSMVNFGQGSNIAVGGNSTAIQVINGGALSSITNTGTISATSAKGSQVALDLAGDSVFATVNQLASGTTTASSITGDVRFGASGAALNLAAGTLTGGVSYGASTLNALTLTNGAILGGALTQATGGQLALDIESGGRLDSTSPTSLTLSSLTLGAQSQIDFAVSPVSGATGSATVVGAIMITSGAKVGLNIDSPLTIPQTITVIQTTPGAGTLVGQPSLLLGDVPFFYVASVNTNTAAGTVALAVRDRTFAEAGVMGSASSYNAVFAANYNDTGIRDAFNSAGTQSAFKRLYNQMLPSYNGGLFEALSEGADAIVRTQYGNPIMQNAARSGGWAQQFGFGAQQGTNSAPGYHGGGLGFAFGWETPASSISTWGVSVSYMRASMDDYDTGPSNQEIGTVYAAGLYWREIDGGLRTDASINAGVAEFNSERNFAGTDLTGTAVSRTADAAWTGGMANAHIGISYEQPVGGDFFVKPSVSGDYFVLYNGSRTEHNGGSAFDLAIASNTGKQGSVTGGLTAGMQFGDRDFTWRPEIMVGYKQVFGGPGDVTAQFAGGSSFSVSPASQKGGAVAHVAIHGGNKYSDFALEAGGEERGDYKGLDGRVVARFQF
jgi:hypothetical protein